MRNCTLVLALIATIAIPALARAELSVQSSVDDILDALDARGKDLSAFTADVKLIEADTGTGDFTTRSGKVWYQAGDSPRLRVTFDKKQAGNRITTEMIEYLLKGPDLIDRNYRTKTETTRHVLKPGEKMNLLKLGEGPFPLPIGQKKEDVHNQFEVKKIEPKREDPADTVHIQLIPKPDTRFTRNFKTIDVWVGTKDSMPRRIETLDRTESATRTTELGKVEINPKLTDADFTLPGIGGDWNRIEEAYNE